MISTPPNQTAEPDCVFDVFDARYKALGVFLTTASVEAYGSMMPRSVR
jgi:hypothetical protein